MTTGEIIRLGLQGLVFLAWAILLARMFATLRARDASRTGGGTPSSGGLGAQFRHWLRSEEDRTERKTLFFLTFVLVTMQAINAFAAQSG